MTTSESTPTKSPTLVRVGYVLYQDITLDELKSFNPYDDASIALSVRVNFTPYSIVYAIARSERIMIPNFKAKKWAVTTASGIINAKGEGLGSEGIESIHLFNDWREAIDFIDYEVEQNAITYEVAVTPQLVSETFDAMMTTADQYICSDCHNLIDMCACLPKRTYNDASTERCKGCGESVKVCQCAYGNGQ
jgi:hypothetical protein